MRAAAARTSGPTWARCSPSTPPRPWCSPSSPRLSVPVPGPARRRSGDPHRRARPRRRAVEGRRRATPASLPAASPSIRRSAIAPASPRRPSWRRPSAAIPSAACASAASVRTTPSRPWCASTSCLGKHLAILGTTGTGKSCTTALILRSILEKNPAAHILLLDPHNEYATAFSRMGGGDQPAQHAAALLAVELRGDRRGPDRRTPRARPRSRSCRS